MQTSAIQTTLIADHGQVTKGKINTETLQRESSAGTMDRGKYSNLMMTRADDNLYSLHQIAFVSVALVQCFPSNCHSIVMQI